MKKKLDGTTTDGKNHHYVDSSHIFIKNLIIKSPKLSNYNTLSRTTCHYNYQVKPL